MLDASRIEEAASEFGDVSGYLNTATAGVPPHQAVEVLREHLERWASARLAPRAYDADVERACTAYATLAGTDRASVALMSPASAVSGLVAANLDAGARVLSARGEFTSVLYPFLADPRLEVELVELDELVAHIDDTVDLVAVSAVQSSDGRVLDLDALAQAATAVGARTYVDATQAIGWVPFEAHRFDVTACGGYKWLCSPRGIGFMTVGSDSEWLVPKLSGWYASASPWESIYGAPLKLADDARRFNFSPAWFDISAAAESLELLADVGVALIGAHSVGLANELRSRLGIDPTNSAIMSINTSLSEELAAAGVTAAARSGRTRLSFYLYNTIADVELAASVLRGENVPGCHN